MTNVTDITTPQVDVPAADDNGTFMQQVQVEIGHANLNLRTVTVAVNSAGGLHYLLREYLLFCHGANWRRRDLEVLNLKGMVVMIVLVVVVVVVGGGAGAREGGREEEGGEG